MRHDITDPAIPIKSRVDKKKLFRAVYAQVDSVFSPIANVPLKIEKWRQVRKIVGEYTGNLYKWDPIVTFVEIEVVLSGAEVELSVCHDGEEFEQSQRVQTIVAGLRALGAQPTQFLGTGAYEGFKLKVQI